MLLPLLLLLLLVLLFFPPPVFHRLHRGESLPARKLRLSPLRLSAAAGLAGLGLEFEAQEACLGPVR